MRLSTSLNPQVHHCCVSKSRTLHGLLGSSLHPLQFHLRAGNFSANLANGFSLQRLKGTARIRERETALVYLLGLFLGLKAPMLLIFSTITGGASMYEYTIPIVK